MTADELANKIQQITDAIWENVCLHEERHRNGIIWTICDNCGQEWADDRGGYTGHIAAKVAEEAQTALEELAELIPTSTLEQRVKVLEGQIEDFIDDKKATLKEYCDKDDRQHCSCVWDLRNEIKRLTPSSNSLVEKVKYAREIDGDLPVRWLWDWKNRLWHRAVNAQASSVWCDWDVTSVTPAYSHYDPVESRCMTCENLYEHADS